MDRLIGELVMLAAPLYLFLQLLTVWRYRGRWRVLALLPLVVMAPLAIHAAAAFAAGSDLWPLLLILASPAAAIYLIGLAIVKGGMT